MHHDFHGIMEKEGKYKGLEVQMGIPTELAKDCYLRRVFYDGLWQVGMSSFFPKDMDRLKVVDFTIEAIQNPVEKPYVMGNGDVRFVGLSKNGLPVEIILDKDAKLIVAYPDTKRLLPE